MRTVTEIQTEIQDLEGKISSVQNEIAEKKESLSEQRQNNARLLASNISKSRRPMALTTQIEKIRSQEIEIDQLSAALEILRGQLVDLETGHHVASLKSELETYGPTAEAYLAKATEIREEIQAVVASMDRITKGISDFTKLQDPLVILQRVFSKVKDPREWQALDFPLGTEADRYRLLNSLMAAEKKIANLPRLLKTFSDLWQGIELGGPNVASRFRYLSDLIPQPGADAVRERPAGPTTKLKAAGRPAIERHPERFAPGDVLKAGAKGRKVPPPPLIANLK